MRSFLVTATFVADRGCVYQRVPLTLNCRVGKGAGACAGAVPTHGHGAPLPTLQTDPVSSGPAVVRRGRGRDYPQARVPKQIDATCTARAFGLTLSRHEGTANGEHTWSPASARLAAIHYYYPPFDQAELEEGHPSEGEGRSSSEGNCPGAD